MSKTKDCIIQFKNFVLGQKATARAHNRDVMGCQAVKKDIMLSFGPEITFLNASNNAIEVQPSCIVDVFMTQEQAEDLYQELGQRIKQNNSGLIKDKLKIKKY